MKHLQWLWTLISVLSLPHASSLAAPLECLGTAPTADEVESWRLEAAQQLEEGTITDRNLASQIRTCFGTQIPVCLQKMNGYVTRNDTAAASLDSPVRSSPAKQPPAELFLNGTSNFEYR